MTNTPDQLTEGTTVTIVGAHGQIARLLTHELTARGASVRGLVRSRDQFDDVRADGGEPVLCDLEAADDDDLDRALAGSDGVVFAAGSGPGSGPERKRTLDRDGAIATVEAAVRIGAQRFVLISSMGADDPPTDDETFSVYLRAKHDADEALRDLARSADLDHTIVRPAALTDDPATGRIRLDPGDREGEISRADVAAVIAELLGSGRGIGSTFEVASGPTPIAEAVAALA